jgi:hypothetical protein
MNIGTSAKLIFRRNRPKIYLDQDPDLDFSKIGSASDKKLS